MLSEFADASATVKIAGAAEMSLNRARRAYGVKDFDQGTMMKLLQ